MIHKHLFLNPALLSRLCFTQSENGDYYVQATTNQKPMRALPEEIIRQLFVLSLIHQYSFPEQNIRVEYPVQIGATKKRADIVILGESGSVEITVEVKQIINHEAVDQLKSYLMVTGAVYGAAVSSHEFVCLKKDTNNIFSDIGDLPIYGGNEVLLNPNKHRGSVHNNSSTDVLLASLKMKNIEKIGKSQVRLYIQGAKLEVSITDLASYKKIQRLLLSKGIILTTEIKQSTWLKFVSELLSVAPEAIPEVVERCIEDPWTHPITTWLSMAETQKRNFLTPRDIFIGALQGTAIKLGRRETVAIANVMRSIGGWDKTIEHIPGVGATRGYKRIGALSLAAEQRRREAELEKNEAALGTGYARWRNTAEQGDVEAQLKLGEAYHQGDGVDKNLDQAVEWYCKAAKNGNQEAEKALTNLLNDLGRHYELGEYFEVKKDINQAIHYYRKAAENGSHEAEKALARLKDSL